MTVSGTSFYSRQTYFPYGAQRTTEGSALPTDYTFTGQKSDDSTGLMFYGARYYDVSLGRFTQPDTIVPSPLNPQSLNRFSYVLNNPVKYTDPTGHAEVCDDPSCGANPPSNPSNNGEVPTAPTAPPANPPVDSPTNPNPEQGNDCKRHCDDADRADGFPITPTRTPEAQFRGKCLGYCTGDGEEEKRGGPIGNGTGEAGNGTAGGGCAGISAEDCFRLSYPQASTSGTQTRIVDGARMTVDEALDAAHNYLEGNYTSMGGGRYVEQLPNGGFRQVRMLDADILADNPHINFETWMPDPLRPGRFIQEENIHIYLLRQ